MLKSQQNFRAVVTRATGVQIGKVAGIWFRLCKQLSLFELICYFVLHYWKNSDIWRSFENALRSQWNQLFYVNRQYYRFAWVNLNSCSLVLVNSSWKKVMQYLQKCESWENCTQKHVWINMITLKLCLPLW